MAPPALSHATREALELLGTSIRVARLHRRWTIRELAERVGVSHVTIQKVERGDPGVALGTALEAATLVGLPLFHPDADVRARELDHRRRELALLPTRAREAGPVDDDF